MKGYPTAIRGKGNGMDGIATLTALRHATGHCLVPSGRTVTRARRVKSLALALVLALAFALLGGVGRAAASTNYACPGLESLESNVGEQNVACGWHALHSNTSAFGNVATGAQTLSDNTSGGGNVASGDGALFSNTTGGDNAASGFRALAYNTSGEDNLADGSLALFYNVEGSYNVASGYEALLSNTIGDENIASGYKALYSNTTGDDNVALGSEAGEAIAAGSNNVDIANKGVTSDSGTTRIGTEGKQTKTFVSGIYAVPPPGGSKTCTVKITETGQLVCSEPQGLKICVPEKAGKPILLAPCTKKKGYKEKEVAEL